MANLIQFKKWWFIIVLLCVFSNTGCDNNSQTNAPAVTYQLTGTVYSYMCEIYQNPILDHYPYSLETGKPAYLYFDNYPMITTDSTSDYSIHLTPGEHRLILEIAQNFPETSYVTISSDTTIDFTIWSAFSLSDSIIIGINYTDQTTDTLTIPQELELLEYLNSKINDVLGISIESRIFYDFDDRLSVNYRLPLLKDAKLWEIFLQCQELFASDPYFEKYIIYADYGVYPCASQ